MFSWLFRKRPSMALGYARRAALEDYDEAVARWRKSPTRRHFELQEAAWARYNSITRKMLASR